MASQKEGEQPSRSVGCGSGTFPFVDSGGEMVAVCRFGPRDAATRRFSRRLPAGQVPARRQADDDGMDAGRRTESGTPAEGGPTKRLANPFESRAPPSSPFGTFSRQREKELTRRIHDACWPDP
jgi:hypothetical protein